MVEFCYNEFVRAALGRYFRRGKGGLDKLMRGKGYEDKRTGSTT